MAFIKLGEPKEHVAIAFQKAINLSEESICEYLAAFGPKSVESLTNAIPETFLPFYKNCASSQPVKKTLDCQKYAAENGLDEALVTLINEISENDQKYRNDTPVDWSKQTPLDKKNMALIDDLYKKYGKYIGKELVGKELEWVMWLVIQHSNIEKMEAYLPVIHKAVQTGDLAQTPLKMLLDRIYCARENYQFFGSQFGGNCEVADEEKRLAISKKYGIE